MEETLKQILKELQKVNHRLDRFEKGQQELKTDVTDLKLGQDQLKLGQDQLKDNLINGLGPYFEQIEKHIDVKTEALKDTLEDQQMVIDTLAARSVKHESEIKDLKRILKNQ